MSVSIQRALVLHQQGRYADAERELRHALAFEPNNADAHALLAVCLAEQKDFAQAQYEADAAVGLAPDDGFAHYARAKVLYDRNRLAEAVAAIEQALRLDTFNADYWGVLSQLRFDQRDWQASLIAAEEGLKADPEHAACTNLRAMALVKLGRRAEAGATIDAALAKDPDNALTHANQGWTLLHRGEPRKAMEHFREALRLDPQMEWARVGIVEALKAHNFIYRWMLLYFLWMNRLSQRAQWAIVLGGYFGYRALFSLAQNNPAVAPYVWPLVIAYIVFALMTWLADPLFNLLLRLNRFGRLALSRQQVMASNVIGLLLLAAILSVAASFWRDDSRYLLLAVVFAGLMLPVSGAFRTPEGWPQWTMIAASATLGLIGLLGITVMFLVPGFHNDSRHPLLGLGFLMLTVFSYGVLASTIAYNYLRSVQVRR